MPTIYSSNRKHLAKQREAKYIKPKEPQTETFSYVPKKKSKK
jgi:hypothetical protein